MIADDSRAINSTASIYLNPSLAGRSSWTGDLDSKRPKSIKKKKKKVSEIHNSENGQSSALDRYNRVENSSIVKRRKKKVKSKIKKSVTANELPSGSKSVDSRSCHSKCKEDYENEQRGSASKYGGFLRYQPMYQNKTQVNINPARGHQKQLARRQSQGALSNNTSNKYLTSAKKIMKRKPKTIVELRSGKSQISINKSLTGLENVQEREPGQQRTKKVAVPNKPQKINSKREGEVPESYMLIPRYSSSRNSQKTSKRSIPVVSEKLYQMGLEKSSIRSKMHEDAMAKKERAQLTDCTFKPSISELARKKSSPEYMNLTKI